MNNIWLAEIDNSLNIDRSLEETIIDKVCYENIKKWSELMKKNVIFKIISVYKYWYLRYTGILLSGYVWRIYLFLI